MNEIMNRTMKISFCCNSDDDGCPFFVGLPLVNPTLKLDQIARFVEP